MQASRERRPPSARSLFRIQVVGAVSLPRAAIRLVPCITERSVWRFAASLGRQRQQQRNRLRRCATSAAFQPFHRPEQYRLGRQTSMSMETPATHTTLAAAARRDGGVPAGRHGSKRRWLGSATPPVRLRHLPFARCTTNKNKQAHRQGRLQGGTRHQLGTLCCACDRRTLGPTLLTWLGRLTA